MNLIAKIIATFLFGLAVAYVHYTVETARGFKTIAQILAWFMIVFSLIGVWQL